MDSKALAMLGVLSAINAALRPLGAGTAGIETVFFLLVLAGRVYGAGFGFVLGCTSLFASALLTAGVGPWLPFQMLCSAWIGLGAGLLPRFFRGRSIRGRPEIVMLVVAIRRRGSLRRAYVFRTPRESPPCRAFADAGSRRVGGGPRGCRRLAAAERLNPLLYLYKALIAEQSGRHSEAGPALKRAIYLDRDFVLAHYYLGLVRQRNRPRTPPARSAMCSR